jgi:hypothetical protein
MQAGDVLTRSLSQSEIDALVAKLLSKNKTKGK